MVSLAGLLPSVRAIPGGSLREGNPAVTKVRWMILLISVCRPDRPALNFQVSPSSPSLSSVEDKARGLLPGQSAVHPFAVQTFCLNFMTIWPLDFALDHVVYRLVHFLKGREYVDWVLRCLFSEHFERIGGLVRRAVFNFLCMVPFWLLRRKENPDSMTSCLFICQLEGNFPFEKTCRGFVLYALRSVFSVFSLNCVFFAIHLCISSPYRTFAVANITGRRRLPLIT